MREKQVERNKMYNGNKICKKCWVASFDLLGFRNKIRNLNDPDSLEANVNVYFEETLQEAKEGVQQYKELLPDIQYGFYADTFFFYIPVDKTGHTFTVIDSLARQFFVKCVWKRHPLCGALSFGLFYAEREENIYIGCAFVDAYEYVEKQNWIGMVITPQALCKLKEYNFTPLDKLAYTVYDVPVKGKEKIETNKIIVPLETENLHSFKHHTFKQVMNRIKDMKKGAVKRGLGQKVIGKYENTLKFIAKNSTLGVN